MTRLLPYHPIADDTWIDDRDLPTALPRPRQLTLFGVRPEPVTDLGVATSPIYIGRIPGDACPWDMRYDEIPYWDSWWTCYDADGRALSPCAGPAGHQRDWEGEDLSGRFADGYDAEGWRGRDPEGYDRSGFDLDGYDREDYDESGFHRDTDRDRAGYDRDGYDDAGEDRRGRTRCDNDACDCTCSDCHSGDDCTCDPHSNGTCDCECDECHSGGDCTCGVPSYHATKHRSIRRSWEALKGLRFGVECETRVPDRDSAYQVRPPGMLGELDGSLDADEGVEWIGPPLTLAEYRNGGLWDRWIQSLRTNHNAIAWNAGDGYGIHVNISRSALDQETQARFVWFVHTHRSFAQRFAGRSSDRWAQFTAKDPNITALQSADKYQAVRVGTHVLEVRIFRSTLNPTTFHKNVEWCAAMMAFAQTSTFDTMTPKAAMGYIQAHSAEYPRLHAWILAHGGY